MLLGVTIAYGAVVSPYFLHSTNLFFICLNVGEVAIMALPLTLPRRHRRDRPVGGLDSRLERRRHGGALQARLAYLVGDDHRRGLRRVSRRGQRLPGHASRLSVSGGDDGTLTLYPVSPRTYCRPTRSAAQQSGQGGVCHVSASPTVYTPPASSHFAARRILPSSIR